MEIVIKLLSMVKATFLRNMLMDLVIDSIRMNRCNLIKSFNLKWITKKMRNIHKGTLNNSNNKTINIKSLEI